jgi:hypothetical protein
VNAVDQSRCNFWREPVDPQPHNIDLNSLVTLTAGSDMDFDEFQATLSDVLQNETTQDALLGLGAASAAALTMGAASRVFGVARFRFIRIAIRV